jgi:pimeloyl-ACP methyl ester carboxylesterase
MFLGCASSCLTMPSGPEGPGATHYRLVPADHPVTVVLLHGLGGDLCQPWDYTDAHVGGWQATRLAIDAREHGETSLLTPGPLGFDLLADDVLDLVDQLAVSDRLLLAGVSMGAGTALRIAQRAPERVHGLVLIRPAWRNQPLPANLAAFGEIAALLRLHGPQVGRARFAESPRCRQIASLSPSAAASLLDQFNKPQALARVRRLEEMPRSVPYAVPADLGAISAPTLVIGAQCDPVHPLEIAQQWAELIPGAGYAEIVGREPSPDQHRAQLRARLDTFLAKL